MTLFFGVLMSSAMSMAFIMSVTVFFMQFFIPFEHRNNMCHRRMSEGGKIEMDNNECAEEYPKENMDHICNLYSSDNVDSGSEEIGVPEKKPGYDLNRDKGCHDHEIRDLLHRIELVVRHGMMRILISHHNTEPVELRLTQGLFCKRDRMVKRRDIDLYLEGQEIVKEPDAVICEQDKAQPAVDLDRPLKRHYMKIIRIAYLRPCYDQDDKTECVHPVPYSDR
jgi:hypothetical protein